MGEENKTLKAMNLNELPAFPFDANNNFINTNQNEMNFPMFNAMNNTDSTHPPSIDPNMNGNDNDNNNINNNNSNNNKQNEKKKNWIETAKCTVTAAKAVMIQVCVSKSTKMKVIMDAVKKVVSVNEFDILSKDEDKVNKRKNIH